MGGYHAEAWPTIRKLLLSKLGEPADASAVALVNSIPFQRLICYQQTNTDDCGVITLMNMESMARAAMTGILPETYNTELQLNAQEVADERTSMLNQLQRMAADFGPPTATVGSCKATDHSTYQWSTERKVNIWLINGVYREYLHLPLPAEILFRYQWGKGRTYWIESGSSAPSERPIIHHHWDMDCLVFGKYRYFARCGLSHPLYGLTHILVLITVTTQSKPIKYFWVYEIKRQMFHMWAHAIIGDYHCDYSHRFNEEELHTKFRSWLVAKGVMYDPESMINYTCKYSRDISIEDVAEGDKHKSKPDTSLVQFYRLRIPGMADDYQSSRSNTNALRVGRAETGVSELSTTGNTFLARSDDLDAVVEQDSPEAVVEQDSPEAVVEQDGTEAVSSVVKDRVVVCFLRFADTDQLLVSAGVVDQVGVDQLRRSCYASLRGADDTEVVRFHANVYVYLYVMCIYVYAYIYNPFIH
jgi:hypothetical protein